MIDYKNLIERFRNSGRIFDTIKEALAEENFFNSLKKPQQFIQRKASGNSGGPR